MADDAAYRLALAEAMYFHRDRLKRLDDEARECRNHLDRIESSRIAAARAFADFKAALSPKEQV